MLTNASSITSISANNYNNYMKKSTSVNGKMPLAHLHKQITSMKKGLLLVIAFFAMSSVFATGLTGTKVIATSGGDYTSIANAISALNTNGVGTGGVTFNIPAGWTETFANESYGAITATGALGNQIIFQKSGAGADPVITAAAGTGAADYIIKITGQYITFNGIDVQDASANTTTTTEMEYGYYITNSSATVGAQNVIIENCSITLNNTNTDANYAVYQNVATTPTNATGANSNNTYTGLTIQNCLGGIYLLGNATYPDIGDVISSSTIGSSSAYSITTASTSINKIPWGIRVDNGSGFTINNNNIQNVGFSVSSVSSSAYPVGLYTVAAQGTCNIYSNKIHNIKQNFTGSSGTSSIRVYGVYLGTAASSTVNIYNNVLEDIYAVEPSAGAGGSSTTSTYGIYLTGANASTSVFNLYFNSVLLSGDGVSIYNMSNACVYNSAGTISNHKNNIYVNTYTVASGSGKTYCLYNAGTLTNANSDYNDYQTSASGVYYTGYTGGSGYLTLASWKAISGSPDPNGKQFNPSITSSTVGSQDMTLSISSQPGAGTYQGTPISSPSITTDILGTTRSNIPYIGAYENATYSFCTTAGTSNPSAVSDCIGSAATMSVTGSGTSATYQWQYSPDNGTTAWANVANSTPANITYSGSTTASLSITAASGATTGAGGYYRCAVSVACNTSTANSTGAQLTVNQPVSIGTSPSAVSATISGSAASMSVSASGSGTLTYQWLHATTSGGTYTAVANGTPANVTYGGSGTSSSLSITAASGATTGTHDYYECTVTGTCGAVTSGNAALTINAAGLSTPPTLAAAANQTVDNNFVITYTNDNTWNAAVTGITVDGGSVLSGSTYYTTPASGSLSVKTSVISALQTAGSHTIIVKATGYNDASISKTTIAGTPTQLALGTPLVTPATNGAVFATEPTIIIEDQYGNVTTSTATVTPTVTSGQTWIIGGSQATGLAAVAGTASFTNLTASTTGASYTGATITFTCGALTSIPSASFNIAAYSSSATDYYKSNGTGGGTWGTASTWLSSPDNSHWFTASVAPTASAVAIDVQSGDIVTIASAVSIGTVTTNNVAATVEGELDVNASGTLTIASGSSLTVTGTLGNLNASTTAIVTTGSLSFGSAGVYTLNVGTSVTPATTGEIPAASWNATSTININGYYGTAPLTTTASSTYGNINVNGIISGTLTLLGASNQNIAGNLTVNPAGAYGGSGQLQILSSSGTNYLTIGGNYTQHGGLVLLDPSSGTTTCRPTVVLGTFTMDATSGSNPSFKANNGTSVGNLVIFGNVSLTNATFANGSSGISNVYFAGAFQSFTASGTTSFSIGTGSLNWYVNSGTNLNLGTSVLGGSTFNTNPAYTYSAFTGTTTTSTSTTNSVTNNIIITSLSSTAGLQPGMTITGTGIPSNTVIVAVNVGPASSIIISKPATASNATVTFTVSSASASTIQTAHLSGLNGNITTTGTNSLSAGTNYTFNGTSAQVTGALLTAANNLTISNSAGVSLSASTTVSGTLTLSSGNLTLGSSNLTLSGAVSGTLGTSQHIITSGAGYVQNTYSSGSYTFPVGFDAADYNPIQITNNAATSQAYTVRAVTTSSVLALSNSLKASWSIGGITQSSSAISIPWNSSTDVTATAPTSGIVFYSNGTSSWSSPGGSTSGSSPNYISSVSGIAASSAANYWTVATCTNASTTNPANVSACSSGSAATMSVTGSGTALTYQWEYSTTSGGTYSNVADGTPTGVTYGSTGTTASLSATAGSTSPSGDYYYKCTVTAACGTAATSSPAKLTISDAIVIGTNPTPTSVAISGSASTMTVSVTGTSPTYQWVHATSAGGTYSNVVDGTPTGVTYSGSTAASLSITAGATASTGTHDYYKCIVSGASPCSNATSNSAALTINAAAALTPPTLSATSNQSVDNDLKITYTNDNTWNGDVSGITVDGGSTLAGSSYYTTPSAGTVYLHTSNIPALQTPGSHTIVFSAATYNDATLVTTNSAGAATQLTISSITSSLTAGATFSVTVTALDQYGNTSNSSAAVSIASSGSGTTSGNIGNLIGGTLTLNSVSYTKAETVTFTASSTGITSSSASNSVTFTAGTATKLAIATITSPQAVSTAFSVTITAQDAYGNNTTSSAAITLASSGTGTLTGNTGSLSGGTLTLSSVKYTKAETVTFTASASGLTTSVASNAVTFNAGPATKLSIATIATQPVGVGFSIVVTSVDANGNPANVTNANLITLTQASGTAGNLAGTLTGTIANGTSSVTISGVIYNKVESTSITATQTSGTPTFTAVTSNSFAVSVVTYYSKASGTMNWTDATWGVTTSGPFNLPITTNGLDNVVIQSGGTVNLNTNYTTSTGTIIVTGTLNITSGYKLTSAAALTVSASTGVLNIANGVTSAASNAGSTNGTLEITAGTLTLNGTMDVSGYFKNSDATAIVYGGSQTLTFENYSVCELNNSSITAAPTATWASNSNLLITNVGSSANLLAINTSYGNFNINDATASTGTYLTSATTGTLSFAGNFVITNTNGTSGKCKVISGSSGQAIILSIGGDLIIPANTSGQFQLANSSSYTSLDIQIGGSLIAGTGWIGSGSAITTLELLGTGKTINTAYAFSGFTSISISGSYSLAANFNANSTSFVNNGTITGTGAINLAGSAAQSITGTGTINNLTLNNSHGATIVSGKQIITGILAVTSGTLNTGTNGITLRSTSITNSAVVDVVGGTITGTVTVERYIPKGFRAYRDIAPEVYGAGTINANWQEGATNANSNPKPGYGIFITGSNTADATNAGKLDANGFDYAAIAGSNTQDYTYDPLYTNPASNYGHFKALSNTTTTNLDPFTGYRLLIRGDRSSNLYTTPVINTQAGLTMYNSTTLRATGNLVYGTVTYSKTGVTGSANGASATSTAALNSTVNGFSLVANPYVAPVLWGTGSGSQSATTTVYGASNAAAAGGINGSYWFLDPTLGATGFYRAYNALTGSSVYTNFATSLPSSGAAGYQYIQPGQAVFVQSASATPKVVFLETAKATNSTKIAVFGATQLSKIYVSLMKQSATTKTFDKVDGAAVAFRGDFGNKTYGPQDALKFSNATDNLAISDKGKNLSIDGRLPATASDAIPLAITKPTATAYQLSIDATNYINEGFEPMLYDAFKNTTKALGTGNTTISFTVDASNAASFSNRFTILFAPSALPVNSIVASAALSNKIATINWNTVGEKNVVAYEVEKSADAKNFTAIEKVTAKNTATASYTSTDNSVTATTYYRIKAISTAGSISYSNVAKLTYNVQLTTYNLYPNPLKGKTLNVELANVVAGKYTVSIYNALGQRVSGQTISHTGGSATHAISIDNVLAAGVYSVTISEANSKQVVHQTNLSVQP